MNMVSMEDSILPVHQGHLEFIFVIGDGPDAADDDPGTLLDRITHQEAVERIDLDIFPCAGDLPQHRLSFLGAEKGFLLQVLQNRHDHRVEDGPAPADDVEMTVGHGIEGSRIDGNYRLRHEIRIMLRRPCSNDNHAGDNRRG